MSWAARQTRHIHSFVSSPHPYSNFHLEENRIEMGLGTRLTGQSIVLAACACPM